MTHAICNTSLFHENGGTYSILAACTVSTDAQDERGKKIHSDYSSYISTCRQNTQEHAENATDLQIAYYVRQQGYVPNCRTLCVLHIIDSHECGAFAAFELSR
jgi:hypothetical protein